MVVSDTTVDNVIVSARDLFLFQDWLQKYEFSTNFENYLYNHIPTIRTIKDLHLIILANLHELYYIRDHVNFNSDKDYRKLQFYIYEYGVHKAQQGSTSISIKLLFAYFYL